MNSIKVQWIDWMKVIGMFFVIWGHCFPDTMSSFIYAFNVPVFFIISGFLSTPKSVSYSFYPKLFKSLVIPYLVLAYIKSAGSIIKEISSGHWWETVIAIPLGFHT